MSAPAAVSRPIAAGSRRVGRLVAAVVASGRIALDRARWARAEGPVRLHDWAGRYGSNLHDGILPFWLEHGPDRDFGGVFGWLDRCGRPIPPGTKPVVPQMRLVYLLSAAHRVRPEPAYCKLAGEVLEFVQRTLWDRRDGGVFWLVDRAGRLLDDRKHVFAQCFALVGLAEYARAFDDRMVGAQALQLFDLLDRHMRDPVGGGYRATALSRDWRDVIAGDRFFGASGGRHQVGLISLLEALLPLYAGTGEERVGAWLDELLRLAIERMVDPVTGHVRIRFDDDWRPIGPDLSSHGHDIKLSWLLSAVAATLGRADDPLVRTAALALAAHTLSHGFDHRRGGVHWQGPPGQPATDRRKWWWPQAEALVGFLNAYQMSAERRYLAAFERQARYVWCHLIDHRHGDWFQWDGLLGRDVGVKANPWKDAYHQGRACLEVGRRLAAMAPVRPETA